MLKDEIVQQLNHQIRLLDSIEKKKENVNKDAKIVNFVSVGYNCEVSMRIIDCFGLIDSFPWSWAYCSDLHSLLKILCDSDYLLKSDVEVAWGGKGIRYVNPDITFHIRKSVIHNNVIDEHEFNEQYLELNSRLKHMMDKFGDLCKSRVETVFLMKIPPKYFINKEYMISINVLLKEICDVFEKISDIDFQYKINVVLSREYPIDEITFTNDHLVIDYVKCYSHDNLTDVGGDLIGWYNIINRYTPVSLEYYLQCISNRLKKRINTLDNKTTELLHSSKLFETDQLFFGKINYCPADSYLHFNYCYEMAKNGNTTFQRRLSQLYYEGKIVARSMDQAIFWSKLSVKSNNIMAINELIGLLLMRNAIGDDEEAYKLAIISSNTKDPSILMRLSKMQRHGKGTVKDLDSAIVNLRLAAESIIGANYDLVDALQERGGPDDLKEAYSIAVRYASSANPRFLIKMSLMYKNGLGVKKDLDMAIYCIQLSAYRQDWVQLMMVDLLIIRNKPGDLETSLKMLHEMVSNSVDARLRLAKLYEEGIGVERDIDYAIDLYSQSLKSDRSKLHLVDLLLKRGGKEDCRKAMDVLESISNLSLPSVQLRLGHVHMESNDVKSSLCSKNYYESVLESGNIYEVLLASERLCRLDNHFKVIDVLTEKSKTNYLAKVKLLSIYLEKNVSVKNEQLQKISNEIVIENNNCVVSFSKKINPELIKCGLLALHGTESECRILFTLCVQYNLRPSYIVSRSKNMDLPLIPKKMNELKNKDISILSIHKIKDVSLNYTLDGHNPILIDSHSSDCIIDDMNWFENNYSSIIDKKEISINPIKSIKNNMICMANPYSHSGMKVISTDKYLADYSTGESIYKTLLAEDVDYLVPCWYGLGDPFKTSLLADAYREEKCKKIGLVVTTNNKWIKVAYPELIVKVYSKDDYGKLLLYMTHNLYYNHHNIRLIGPWPILITHISGLIANLYYKPDDRCCIDHFKDYLGLSYDAKCKEICCTKNKFFISY